jgi:hypothetical protein
VVKKYDIDELVTAGEQGITDSGWETYTQIGLDPNKFSNDILAGDDTPPGINTAAIANYDTVFPEGIIHTVMEHPPVFFIMNIQPKRVPATWRPYLIPISFLTIMDFYGIPFHYEVCEKLPQQLGEVQTAEDWYVFYAPEEKFQKASEKEPQHFKADLFRWVEQYISQLKENNQLTLKALEDLRYCELYREFNSKTNLLIARAILEAHEG